MKRLLVLATLLGAMLAPQAPLQARVLGVEQCYQEQDQWCWAGSSQAILRYYWKRLAQTDIAAYGTEGQNIWNWLWGQSTDPTRRGIDLILTHFATIATTTYSRALTQTEIGTEINASRPFVIRWGWDSGGGHFVVARGLTGDMAYLMDPWPDNGPTVNTYDWVVRGGTHTWTHTLGMQNAPVPLHGAGLPATLLLISE